MVDPRGNPPTSASSGTIPTYLRKSGSEPRPSIEPGSPRWEASRLAAQPPRNPSRMKLIDVLPRAHALIFYNIISYGQQSLAYTKKTDMSTFDITYFVQVKQWRDSGMTVKMCTARPAYQTMSLTQPKYKKKLHNIDISLIDILEVDTKKMTVRCEPMVTMGQITATLNPLGLSIPIVPELDDLTVGGLIMGTGVESSSHIYGLFQHICVSYELVLPDSSVVTCSKGKENFVSSMTCRLDSTVLYTLEPQMFVNWLLAKRVASVITYMADQDPDLFYAIPWSYGTLGLLTAAEIKIVPAKRYVKLEYYPYHDLSKMTEAFDRRSCSKKDDFVEGLMFSKNEGVLMMGNMVSECEPDKVSASRTIGVH
ncbi:hypothetical protein PR048_029561 [Dryococelus australis]|uniref:Delta(24)-sterol reductase n=1 Tax=Dryococelus australis TaxID=614101 RepID=A0ABQ9GFY7_9NEOP|nr:hypothetical protein PR048_029561 [Dryococelus australis]